MKTMVSVIITTKNEADNLHKCLESLTKQTFRDIEIIVVDNASRDATKQIAKRYTGNVFDAGPERSAQRNFGASKAKGEYLLFLDADMILTPNVVKECVSQKRIAVVIPEKSFGIGFWARCKTIERSLYEGVEWMEASRFYRKNVFQSLRGFDESLTGPEDLELAQRLKSRYGVEAVGRIRSYILHNEGYVSLAKLLAKKYYYGRQMRRYGKIRESQKYFAKQINIFMRYVLFFRRPQIFLTDPLHAVGMICMKTMEMGALAVGSI